MLYANGIVGALGYALSELKRFESLQVCESEKHVLT